MLIFVLRKLLKIKWLAVCLLIGCTIAVAVLSSIPSYHDGMMQKTLTKDLQNIQAEGGPYPGTYEVLSKLYYVQNEDYTTVEIYNAISGRIEKEIIKDLDLPVLSSYKWVRFANLVALRPEVDVLSTAKSIDIMAQTNMDDKIKIVQGRMPSKEPVNDVYEAMMTNEALVKTGLMLDTEYEVSYKNDKGMFPITVKIVGVFDMKADEDPLYWSKGLDAYYRALFVNYETAEKSLFSEYGDIFSEANFYYAIDYKKITLSSLEKTIGIMKSAPERLGGSVTITAPSLPVMEGYLTKTDSMTITLTLLQIPLILIILFYIYMVSRLTIEYDSNEISMLKSRGASRLQIVAIYLLEGLLIGGVSLIFGYPLGLFICRSVGFADGFLQFVNRTPIPILFSFESVLLGLAAVVLFVLTMMLPAVIASGKDIVLLKLSTAQKSKLPIWQRLGLDVILIALSFYGLYSYYNRKEIVAATGAEGVSIPMDPLMFMISASFILGAGLLFIRIYPYILKFVFSLGQKVWNPTIYASLLNVARSKGMDRFIMLFLVFSVSLGIFNAASSRTLNQNEEDKIRYRIGADLVVQSRWEPADSSGKYNVYEDEPPIEPYYQIKGVESITKVLSRKGVRASYSGRAAVENVNLMGVIPSEFAKVAWTRRGLMPYSLNTYLTILSSDEKAVLVSSSLMAKMNLEPGDTIYLNWNENRPVECVVYAAVDYFPTYIPSQTESAMKSDLIVGNFEYIKRSTMLEPYQVWMKKSDDVTTQQVYNELKKNKIILETAQNADQLVIKAKNDPMLQSTNGFLTMGFVLTMLISAIGFLIFWILSIKGRMLQFGILRSMGISKKKLILMILYDQLLISLASILMGVVIGNMSARLFVPIFKLVDAATDQVPPLRLIVLAQDFIRIYSVVGIIFITGLLVLGYIVSKLKISQTIKLGED